MGATHLFLNNTFIPAFVRGWQDVLWLLRHVGIASALRWLGEITRSGVEFGSMLADIELASYLLVGGKAAAIAGLAVAGYELYRHWDSAKRRLSRWINSAHKAIAHLRKWVADTIKSAAAYAGNPIASLTATLPNAPHRLAATTGTTRGMNSALAVERAGAVTPPVPMLRAVRRAAAAAAFVAPLMLASAPAGAFAPPPVSTNDTALITASFSTADLTQRAIVINYVPHVTIHSEDTTDTDALKRRVMEILERHGRELHQVLQREMIRQERRDFQPRYSNGQE
jgi:hypothetical protein